MFSFVVTLFSASCSKDNTILDGETRILLIGNSFSEDALGNYFAELSKNAGKTFVVGILYIGGGSLEDHVKAMRENKTVKYREFNQDYTGKTLKLSLLSALNRQDWTYVSVQQHSSKSGIYLSYHPYLNELLSVIENNTRANKIIHQTWSYEAPLIESLTEYDHSSFVMFDSIANVTDLLSKEYGLKVVPCGETIDHFRKLSDNMALTTDGKHLNRYGKYIAAYAWYAAIFRESLYNHMYYPQELDSSFVNKAKDAVVLSLKE